MGRGNEREERWEREEKREGRGEKGEERRERIAEQIRWEGGTLCSESGAIWAPILLKKAYVWKV